ncbi:hypothetical protein D6201_05655 [Aurantiacibacter aquimixticola]|uniref:Uncharacterized protein n=2 Tax=Aurantiacibacter aquimixticola TaxID=1958945 RepID=A0A419RSY6_9SPHN|nr:hypothetical protein D6201_05655 [Aurantiacibacter aquimixticola]
MMAALSLAATPAGAVELPAIGSAPDFVETGAAAEQSHHHRYRRYRHRNRHRGIGIGDVITGAIILGTIATIANRSRGDARAERRYPDRDDRRSDRDYRESGLERAADMCADAVERDGARVDEITQARRAANGWYVSGVLENGEGWTCTIGNDGRVRHIEYGVSAAVSRNRADTGSQWSASDYARARAATRTPADEAYSYRDEPAVTSRGDGPQPAYPGGPLPGEEGYDDARTDGRYDMSGTTDYGEPTG